MERLHNAANRHNAPIAHVRLGHVAYPPSSVTVAILSLLVTILLDLPPSTPYTSAMSCLRKLTPVPNRHLDILANMSMAQFQPARFTCEVSFLILSVPHPISFLTCVVSCPSFTNFPFSSVHFVHMLRLSTQHTHCTPSINGPRI